MRFGVIALDPQHGLDLATLVGEATMRRVEHVWPNTYE
jgi:hypothetical protein